MSGSSVAIGCGSRSTIVTCRPRRCMRLGHLEPDVTAADDDRAVLAVVVAGDRAGRCRRRGSGCRARPRRRRPGRSGRIGVAPVAITRWSNGFGDARVSSSRSRAVTVRLSRSMATTSCRSAHVDAVASGAPPASARSSVVAFRRRRRRRSTAGRTREYDVYSPRSNATISSSSALASPACLRRRAHPGGVTADDDELLRQSLSVERLGGARTAPLTRLRARARLRRRSGARGRPRGPARRSRRRPGRPGSTPCRGRRRRVLVAAEVQRVRLRPPCIICSGNGRSSSGCSSTYCVHSLRTARSVLPVNALADHRAVLGRAQQRVLVAAHRARFGRRDEARADPHAVGAERERGGETAAVEDAARGDDRDVGRRPRRRSAARAASSRPCRCARPLRCPARSRSRNRLRPPRSRGAPCRTCSRRARCRRAAP